MFYNLYQLWNIYRVILHFHGIYVAYSFLCWTLSTSYTYLAYMISFFYVVEPIKQIKDKEFIEKDKDKDKNILDELD